jgi:hypothetical protein
MVLRDTETVRDLLDRDQLTIVCGEVHQQSESVVGLKVQAHLSLLKDVFEILLIESRDARWKRSDNSRQGPSRPAGKEFRMFRLLMRPANAVCDAMRVTDENERGMIRMLVNMLLLSVIAVIGFVVMVSGV